MKEHFSPISQFVQKYHNSPSSDIAYIYIKDDGEQLSLSYRALDHYARAIGQSLSRKVAKGERVILMYRPGLEFIKAFFGCLYAGVVAVPVYPPNARKEHWQRLANIEADARASLFLMDAANAQLAEKWLPELAEANKLMCSCSLSGQPDPHWQPVNVAAHDIAFLQYTSGSTGQPKGVMVSHQNLIDNEAVIKTHFEHGPDTKVMGWLPQYHDMGLIGNILQPVYLGVTAVLMSPAAFLQNPYRWLKAVSEHKITTSGGPNFAYELCAERISDEQKQTLDLSSWKVAFNGAEQINPDTLERFYQAFKQCGFRKKAFYPCYGLAESTLFVAGSEVGGEPKTLAIDSGQLKHNRILPLDETSRGTAAHIAACGRFANGQGLIVNPQTHEVCAGDEVGEVWLSSRSVALGYWDNPQQTQQTFRARLSGGSEEYLRTGDLGFVHQDELYITGRIKDLIILRGRNYYPQDIEQVVQQELPQLRTGHGACFAVEVDGEEQAVLIQEVERTALRSIDLEQTAARVRDLVRKHCDLSLYQILLTKPGRVLKTSSGKIRRRECKQLWLDNGIESLYCSSHQGDTHRMPDAGACEPLAIDVSDKQQVSRRLAQILAAQMQLSHTDIKGRESITSYGLDSLGAVQLQGKIADEFGVSLQVSDLLYGMTLEQCAVEIMQEQAGGGHVPPAAVTGKNTLMSANQKTFWQLQNLHWDSTAYNLSVPLRLEEDIDPALFDRAVTWLVRRHPVLVTCYPETDGEPVPTLQSPDMALLAVEDASAWQEQELGQAVQSFARLPIDLAQGPVFKARLLKLSPGSSLFHLVVHHIAADFWSLLVLISDLLACYRALKQGKEPERTYGADYHLYAGRQQAWLNGARYHQDLRFWQKLLKGSLKPVSLIPQKTRQSKFAFKGADVNFAVDASDYRRLKQKLKTYDLTLYQYLFSVYQLLLHRYAQDDNFVIGSPFTAREGEAMASVIGCFVDMKLIPCRYRAQQTFVELLLDNKQQLLEIMRHRHVPTQLILQQFADKSGRDPAVLLPNVRFALHRSHLMAGAEDFALGLPASARVADMEITSFSCEPGIAHADLGLTMIESGGGLQGQLNYNSDLMDDKAACQFISLFKQLLHHCLVDEQRPLAKIPLTSEAYQQGQLDNWRHRRTEYRAPAGIHQLFEQQVQQYPHHIAVRWQDKSMDYLTLNQYANRLSHYLMEKGVAKGQRIGLFFNRNADMIAAFYAVLKAGACAVFFDPATPVLRCAYMEKNAELSLLLTDRHDTGWSGLKDKILTLADLELSTCSSDNPRLAVQPGDSAYLLYTSGSTGEPKAVVGLHRGMLNRTLWMREHFAISREDRVLHCTPMNYVRAEREIVFALSSGATLALADSQSLNKAGSILAQIEKFQATYTASSPSLLGMMQQSHGGEFSRLTCVKHWFIGADVLKADLVSWIREQLPQLQLTYFYGSTEVSSDVSFFTVPYDYRPDNAVLPVGKALANTSLYLLDDNMMPVADGLVGELYIGGDNLSGGYFNARELTAEKFIRVTHLHRESTDLYRTGDLARYLPCGNLSIVGRRDSQVSILGNRIELAEIELCIKSLDTVSQVVVHPHSKANGDKVLVAYVVSARGDIDLDIKAQLKLYLPAYMHPSFIVPLEEIPLTPLGKIDRSRLPSVSSLNDLVRHVTAPKGQLESRLVAVWAGVMGVSPSAVDIHDSFFELGGNSALVNSFYAGIKQALPGHPLKITDVYKHSNIKALAAFLAGREKAAGDAAVKSDRGTRRRQAQRRAIRSR
ncbi:non-ribosomal peptide synthetase [Thalassomonas viridans]|uniref:Non-ribosomal peptide synthetase n=1 Tax=Thalassomonas viridans TaxID=137584 RepID=A0AAE9Z9H2_9GAMM|nr:non-ribosomal peptide synthetase [Thalassomonas viridans]WDE09236.1 non-ribosomal peptide synthetase [Thalassomonas viridans]